MSNRNDKKRLNNTKFLGNIDDVKEDIRFALDNQANYLFSKFSSNERQEEILSHTMDIIQQLASTGKTNILMVKDSCFIRTEASAARDVFKNLTGKRVVEIPSGSGIILQVK